MNALLAIPIEIRLALLMLLGALLGSWVNWAVCALSYHRSRIGPWFPPPVEPKKPRRKKPAPLARIWTDRVPVVGWLGMRRESRIHGRAFWVRPLFVEFGLGLGLAILYWWEVESNALGVLGRPLLQLPPNVIKPFAVQVDLSLSLHMMFLSHLILITLMLAASLIDIDEKTIPDGITVPGTLLGLLLAASMPWSLLPAGVVLLSPGDQPDLAIGRVVEFLTTTSPWVWPVELTGSPHVFSFLLGLGCFWIWTTALLYRPWRTGRGWGVALRILGRHMRRDFLCRSFLALNTLGPLVIALVWWRGGIHWIGLLSALSAMVLGGLMIWVVRLIGAVVLRKEAMGFGDVTLMAMIGTFLGWQPSLLIFFIAPVVALVFGLAQYLLRREAELFYGPFLSLASLVVIVRWKAIWDHVAPIFELGWIILAVMVIAFMLMAIMLAMLRLAKWLFAGRR